MNRILKMTIGVFLIMSEFCMSQDLQNLDSYSVDEVYKKIDLDYGTLDEDGQSIDHVFIKSNLDAGTYEIDLTDGPGDLYEISGTDIYLKFRGYFGYAGYGTQCILKVEGQYSLTLYKLD
jgi:hypothetical protein